MPRLVAIASACLFLIALSGCLGGNEAPPPSPSPSPEPEPEPGPQVLPWGLTDCRASIGLIPVASNQISSFLPAGFVAMTPAEFGLPEDPRGDAILGVESFKCASGVGLNGTVNNMDYGSYFTPVKPTPEYTRNVTFHFVKWQVLIPDADRRAALANHTIPALGGSTSFDPDVVQGGTGAFATDLTMDGQGSQQWAGVTALEADTSPISFVEYTPTDHGLAVWYAEASVDWASQGSGVFVFSSGSFPNTVVGSSATVGYFLNFEGDFSNATITMPVMAEHHH